VALLDGDLAAGAAVRDALRRATAGPAVLVQYVTARLALAAFAVRRPDVFLLELDLDDRSGIEVIRTLRADPHWAGIPIIVLTAAADGNQLAAATEAGADSYVLKPFDLDLLVEIIRDALATRR
jgi:DNA-binding response OmpR family regulator